MPGKQVPGFIKRFFPAAYLARLEGKLPPDEMWRLSLGVVDRNAEHFRRMFALLPANQRCQMCNAPFTGPMVPILRAMHFAQSTTNPRFCRQCLEANPPGGAEIELTILFADVRGSTALAEQMPAQAFSELINRFYVLASKILINTNALTGRLIGDEVMGLYVPGFAGSHHAAAAIRAAQELVRGVGYGSQQGPWLPVGVGINTGIAFAGRFGDYDSTTDITAVGDSVNLAARLASQAAGGEILVTEATLNAAQLDLPIREERVLALKGKSEPVTAHIWHT